MSTPSRMFLSSKDLPLQMHLGIQAGVSYGKIDLKLKKKSTLKSQSNLNRKLYIGGHQCLDFSLFLECCHKLMSAISCTGSPNTCLVPGV